MEKWNQLYIFDLKYLPRFVRKGGGGVVELDRGDWSGTPRIPP